MITNNQINVSEHSRTDWDLVKQVLAQPYSDDEYLEDQKKAYDSARNYILETEPSDATLKERYDI